MTQELFDYVILGASPSGCYLGKLLQQAGHATLMVDPAAGPRDGAVVAVPTAYGMQVTRIHPPLTRKGAYEVHAACGRRWAARYLILSLDAEAPVDAACFVGSAPRVRPDDGTPYLDGGWGSVNLDGLYMIGTSGTGRAVPLPGSAHLTAVGVLFRLMQHQHHGVPYRYRLVPCTPEAIARNIMGRLEAVGAHTQPQCKTGDMIALVPHGKQVYYFEEVEDRFDPNAQGLAVRHWFTVRLEVGTAVRRGPATTRGHLVLRHCYDGRTDELILGLSDVWTKAMTERSLRSFFCSQLQRVADAAPRRAVG